MQDLLSWILSTKYSQKLCLTFGTRLSSAFDWQLSLCNEGEKAQSVTGILEAKWHVMQFHLATGDCPPLCWVVIWNNLQEMKMLPNNMLCYIRLTDQQKGFRSVSLKVLKADSSPLLCEMPHPAASWSPKISRSGNKYARLSYKISSLNQNTSDRNWGLADKLEM